MKNEWNFFFQIISIVFNPLIPEKYYWSKHLWNFFYHIQMCRNICFNILNVLRFISLNKKKLCYILTFDPAQKYYSKVIHRKEVTHSNGQ